MLVEELRRVANLKDRAFFTNDPHPVLSRLRREAPVFWHEAGQFWALTKYEDCRLVSRSTDLFSVTQGITIADNLRPDRGAGMMPPGAELMLRTDPPRHTHLRRVVNKAFTPRMVARMESAIRGFTVDALSSIDPGRPFDFIDVVAKPVPLNVIGELLGIPLADRGSLIVWSDLLFAYADEGDDAMLAVISEQLFEMVGYFNTLIEDRRVNPRDDIITALLAAEIEGEHLSAPTLLAFIIQLLSAGNETTRNVLSGAALALAEHPAQLKILLDTTDLDRAIEEFLRWVSPVLTLARTATAATVIRGQEIAAGDYVVMFYPSANRDEDVWPRAQAFDVTRDPAPGHLAFGYGPHQCLGASLARVEIRIVFEELLNRFSTFSLGGPIQRLPSTFVNGITSMPFVLDV